MEWKFSDGTVVRLGGVVEGDGPMAKRLRGDLELIQYGRGPSVSVAPQPGGNERLNPSDPYHIDSWVRSATRWIDVKVVSGPKLEPQPIVRSDPDRIY